MHALAHLGPAVANLDVSVFGEPHDGPHDLEETVPEPGVLEPEAEADGFAVGDRLVVGGLHGLEARPRSERAVVHHLPGAPDHSRRHGVAEAHLPRADADLRRQAVDDPFHRELRLVGAKAAKGAAHRVVGPHGDGLDLDRRQAVGTGRVPGGALEDLHPDRRVGPGVSEHPGLQSGQHAFNVAAGPVLDAERVTLGVHEQRLLT